MKYIMLTNGNRAIIDDLDYDLVQGRTWMEGKSFVYAKDYLGKIGGKYKWRTVLLHRLIMNPPSKKVVDHINGDILDNRRDNLRVCLNKQNVRNAKLATTNTSGYKGVSWSRQRRKWVATIYHTKSINLGGFDTKEKAALAYDRAAKLLFGKYARTNFK